MIIPYQELSVETLRNVLSTFVTRYDEQPIDDDGNIEEKVERLIFSLKSKKIFLSYDEESETFNLLTKEQAAQLDQSN